MKNRKVVLNNYQVFFVDMDGVVVISDQPVSGSIDGMNRLNSLGKVYILSNNSTKTRKSFSDNMAELGLDFPPERIVNSAYVLARYLKEQSGSLKVFTVGENGLDEELEQIGHSIVKPAESKVLAVGMDRNLTYDKLDKALTGLLAGARFFATNDDRTFPTPEGQSPGAGASVGAIKGMGFEPERIVGKPSRVSAKTAMEVAGTTDPNKCLVIGDRLETDILMAERAGMDSVLVLSGVESRRSLERSEIEPTFVVEDMSALFQV